MYINNNKNNNNKYWISWNLVEFSWHFFKNTEIYYFLFKGKNFPIFYSLSWDKEVRDKRKYHNYLSVKFMKKIYQIKGTVSLISSDSRVSTCKEGNSQFP